MNDKKQNKEMTSLLVFANDINHHCPDLKNYYCVACLANALYKAGYRKQSEITRCKDCIYSEESQGACLYCRLHDTRFDKNGFCSYGKMKGGGEK